MKQRAIAYVRVSSDGQDRHGSSMRGQVQEIEQFCRDHDIELRTHFLEVESAKNAHQRPVFKAALYAVHSNPDINYIVFTNLDRFARNTIDSEGIRQTLERKGKRLISTQQRLLTPLFVTHEDADPIAALQHAAVDNDRERRKIAKRMMDGRNRKVAAGGWVGTRPPFGYIAVQGELVICKEHQTILRLIRRLSKLQIDGERRFSPRKSRNFLNEKIALTTQSPNSAVACFHHHI